MIARLLFACALLLLPALPDTAQAQRLAGQTMLTDTPYGYALVSSPTRAGRRAQRFEVRAGDCGRSRNWDDCAAGHERAGFTLREVWRYGTERWIGFSVFLPQDFRTSPRVRTSIAQINQRGGPTRQQGGIVTPAQVMHLDLLGDRFVATVHILSGSATDVRNDIRALPLASVDAMLGRWTDVLIRFDTSGDADALEVYLNGQRRAGIVDLVRFMVDQGSIPVYDREAVIENFIRFRPQEYYFHYGILRTHVSRHGGPMPTQVLLIDEVRMGRNMQRAVVNEQRPVD